MWHGSFVRKFLDFHQFYLDEMWGACNLPHWLKRCVLHGCHALLRLCPMNMGLVEAAFFAEACGAAVDRVNVRRTDLCL
jgi:hypothetical protein